LQPLNFSFNCFYFFQTFSEVSVSWEVLFHLFPGHVR
jgi:hypothetical protein